MSNDYHLTKIYESLNRNSSVHSKKQIPPEKFQTLSDVYHQIIFKKLNEDTVILMQQGGSNNVEEFSIPDDLADKIKKQISGEITREVNGKKISLKEIINDVLKSKKWHEGTDGYFELLKVILNIFSSKNINFEKIADYLSLVNKNNSNVEQEFLKNPEQILSLKNLIPSWFNDFFEDKKGIEIASKLWDIRFKHKNTVGRGELMFTLISDSKKGDKDTIGDLFFDTLGSVEVKGLAGKMGGDGFVNTQTPILLNNIYSKETKNNNLQQKTINRVQLEIQKEIENILKNTKKRKIPLNIKNVEEILLKINNFQSLSEFNDLIEQSNFTSIEKNTIKRGIQKLLKYKLSFDVKDSSKDAGDFKTIKNEYRPALTTFFTSFLELTDEQLIEGILACRSYTKLPPQDFYNYIKDEITTNKNEYFNELDITEKLKYFIATLHVVEYQKDKKFKGILFMNDLSKNMIYYPFKEGISFTDTFKLFFNFLKKYKPNISLSMSSQQASVNIAFAKI